MSMLVFVGPSIAGAELAPAPSYCRAPPIRRGDLEKAEGYDPIVIIDGEFGQALSVSPKEILRLIDAKKTVIGGGSMGALRASELDVYGMIGVGWIYQRFAGAAVRRDDDVALTYSPVDYLPLTVPMINIEYWMSSPVVRAQTSARERNKILSRNRSIFFGDRTEKAVRSIFESTIGAARFETLVDELGGELPDIKRLDAKLTIAVATRIAQDRHNLK
jgi:TfuA protein